MAFRTLKHRRTRPDRSRRRALAPRPPRAGHPRLRRQRVLRQRRARTSSRSTPSPTRTGAATRRCTSCSRGHARFEIDGDTVDAPAGTLVFLPEPTSRRYAVAEADGTTVLALGGEPGVAYDVSAWEWRFRAQPHIDAEEWEKGIALMHDGLAATPGRRVAALQPRLLRGAARPARRRRRAPAGGRTRPSPTRCASGPPATPTSTRCATARTSRGDGRGHRRRPRQRVGARRRARRRARTRRRHVPRPRRHARRTHSIPPARPTA